MESASFKAGFSGWQVSAGTLQVCLWIILVLKESYMESVKTKKQNSLPVSPGGFTGMKLLLKQMGILIESVSLFGYDFGRITG